MHDLKTIRKPNEYVEDPISTTELCRFCLMCRHVCPVGHVTHNETLTPHGWGLMIASNRRGLLEWDQESVDALYKCANCELCHTHCVTNQPLPVAIASARAEVVEKGLAPEAVRSLDQALQKWANPYVQEYPERASSQGEIGLYIGDGAHHVDPSTSQSALQLLKAAGVEPVMLGVGRSSGVIASSLGLSKTAEELARSVLDEVAETGCKKVLVLAPVDLYAFKILYRERFNLTWPTDVEVQEVVSFLYDAQQGSRLSLDPKSDSRSYAYHDPCYAARTERDHSTVRKLLSKNLGSPPMELFWHGKRAHPCGATGGLDLIQPTLARQLTEARLEDVRSSGATLLITEDAVCLKQLQQYASSDLQVRGLYETLID